MQQSTGYLMKPFKSVQHVTQRLWQTTKHIVRSLSQSFKSNASWVQGVCRAPWVAPVMSRLTTALYQVRLLTVWNHCILALLRLLKLCVEGAVLATILAVSVLMVTALLALTVPLLVLSVLCLSLTHGVELYRQRVIDVEPWWLCYV